MPAEATAEELEQQQALELARQQETARAQQQAQAAQPTLPGGDIAEKMTEFVKKFPLLGPIFATLQKTFPVWVWTLINSAKTFPIFIIVLLLTPLWWGPLVGIAQVSKGIQLPFLPKLPRPGDFEAPASALAFTAVLLTAAASVLLVLCATPQGLVTRTLIKAGAAVGIEAAETAVGAVKLCEGLAA